MLRQCYKVQIVKFREKLTVEFVFSPYQETIDYLTQSLST